MEDQERTRALEEHRRLLGLAPDEIPEGCDALIVFGSDLRTGGPLDDVLGEWRSDAGHALVGVPKEAAWEVLEVLGWDKAARRVREISGPLIVVITMDAASVYRVARPG